MNNFINFLKQKFNFSFFKKNIYNLFIIFFIFAYGFTLGHYDVINNQNLIISNQIIEVKPYAKVIQENSISNFNNSNNFNKVYAEPENYYERFKYLTSLEFYTGLGYIFIFIYMFIIGLYNDYKKARD